MTRRGAPVLGVSGGRGTGAGALGSTLFLVSDRGQKVQCYLHIFHPGHHEAHLFATPLYPEGHWWLAMMLSTAVLAGDPGAHAGYRESIAD